jgi:hypothetical protein
VAAVETIRCRDRPTMTGPRAFADGDNRGAFQT